MLAPSLTTIIDGTEFGEKKLFGMLQLLGNHFHRNVAGSFSITQPQTIDQSGIYTHQRAESIELIQEWNILKVFLRTACIIHKKHFLMWFQLFLVPHPTLWSSTIGIDNPLKESTFDQNGSTRLKFYELLAGGIFSHAKQTRQLVTFLWSISRLQLFQCSFKLQWRFFIYIHEGLIVSVLTGRPSRIHFPLSSSFFGSLAFFAPPNPIFN